MAPIFTGSKFGFGRGAVDALNPLGINPGDSLEGGFFAGYISHTANSVPTHALIVAPAATGATGTGYTLITMKQWKTTQTTTSGTSSEYDGAANSANMNNASHPAAQFCEDLSIGGYTDWYLPAPAELEIAYYNLKPSTVSNTTSWGGNAYSVPTRSGNYTSGNPSQTTVIAFQTCNSEAFIADRHWSSRENGATDGYLLSFQDGDPYSDGFTKTSSRRVRAFRKVSL